MLNTIRAELLAGLRLTPFRFREVRPGPNYDNLTPKVRRRRQYTMLQRRWRKDRGKVVKDVLDGKDPLASTTFPPGTAQYWVGLFSRESPPIPNIEYGDVDLLEPVSPEEITWLKKTIDRSSAPGPDGLTSAQFLELLNDRLQTAYTLVLQSGESSEVWQFARTTLIPKTSNPENPADFQPITMMSVLTRGLHKILARRMFRRVSTDEWQRGFKAEDGVAANLCILKHITNNAKSEVKPLYVAFIDFKKAFDSVYQGAILKSAGAAGLDHATVQYLKSVYNNLSTAVMGVRAKIKQGVAQGDPLSPLLFNLTSRPRLENFHRALESPWAGNWYSISPSWTTSSWWPGRTLAFGQLSRRFLMRPRA